jgi:hypothetical protein
MFVQLHHCTRAAAATVSLASVSLRFRQGLVTKRPHDVVRADSGVCEKPA